MGLGQGGRTFEPIPQNPSSQGSNWFYRSPFVATRNPPGTGVTVNRAPWAVVPDMEAGANPYMNQGKAFTPEGTLAPITDTRAFPPGTFAMVPSAGTGFAGALAGAATPESVMSAVKSLFLWGFVGGAAVGLIIGAVISKKEGSGRAVDAAIGSGLGAFTGLAGAVLVGRGATLAAKMAQTA